MKSENDPEALKKVIEKLLKNLGAPDTNTITNLIEKWPEIVGLEFAKYVTVVAVRESQLVVQVEDPSWASQIAWLENTLLEKISGLFGENQIISIKAQIKPAALDKKT